MVCSDVEARSLKISALSELLGKSLSVNALRMFLEATSDVPSEDFFRGIQAASRSCRYMPSPAQFRELATGPRRMPSVDDEVRAYQKRWGISE